MRKIKDRNMESKILIISSIILAVFIIFSASFFLTLINRSFYDKSFDKHGVYKELGVLGVRNTVDYLINYLTSENTEINEIKQLTIFKDEERDHLEDVKKRVVWIKALSIAALILLITIILRLYTILKPRELMKNIKKILFITGISSLIILAILLFFTLINFTAFFEIFHKILFPMGNYSFPSHYLLIIMFPQGFFIDFAKRMLFHTGILSLILILLSSSSALAVNNTRRN